MATRSPSVTRALAAALRSAQLQPVDAAAVALAKVLAAAVDDAHDSEDLARAGRLMLPVLTALGMTPAARGSVANGGPVDAPSASRLDDLRARRSARANRAAALDPTAP